MNEKRRDYLLKYQKENHVQMNFRLRRKEDEELIEFLRSCSNRNDMLREMYRIYKENKTP